MPGVFRERGWWSSENAAIGGDERLGGRWGLFGLVLPAALRVVGRYTLGMIVFDAASTLAFGFPNLGPWEMVALLVIALLLFGKRLPEVGKSLGKGIVEFKRGIKGIEDEIDSESNKPTPKSEAARPPLTAAGEDERVSFQQGEAQSEPAPPAGRNTGESPA